MEDGAYHNSRNKGHKAGLATVETVIKVALEKNIPYLTLYAFFN